MTAPVNVWAVALTFEDETEKSWVQDVIKEKARRQYRSPSALIKILILDYVNQQTEDLQ